MVNSAVFFFKKKGLFEVMFFLTPNQRSIEKTQKLKMAVHRMQTVFWVKVNDLYTATSQFLFSQGKPVLTSRQLTETTKKEKL